MLELITIGVRVVVERNYKTLDAEMNALMNVWKNVPDEKNGFTKQSSIYYSIWNYTRLANLSKFMNLSLLVDNLDDKIYNRQIDLLGSGTIFKSSVAGPSTSMAEAENTKSARCKKSLKEDSIKNLQVGDLFHNDSGFKGSQEERQPQLHQLNQQWEQEVRNRMYFTYRRIAFTVD